MNYPESEARASLNHSPDDTATKLKIEILDSSNLNMLLLIERPAPMPNVVEELESLRRRIADLNDAELPAAYLQSLAITQIGDVFHLDFYGDCFEEGYEDLLNTLANPDIAACARSLNLRGPDEGANGTKNWDIEPLLATETSFSELETLAIQLNQPADHNRSVVAADYEEDGVLARLLAKAPRLQELTVPSAPNRAFFEAGHHPLRFLSVDAGYDTQNFISHLAGSTCFFELRTFEWGEYHETYMDDYLTRCTSLDDYRELFQSEAFGSVTRFVWRNPVCTEEQIRELKALKPDLQLLVVRYSDKYV